MDPVLFTMDKDRQKQLEHGERLFRKILDQEGTRLPSDRRYEARQRTVVDGVAVPRSLYDTLTAFAEGKSSSSRRDYEGDHVVKDHVA
jgi:hypothetical protein